MIMTHQKNNSECYKLRKLKVGHVEEEQNNNKPVLAACNRRVSMKCLWSHSLSPPTFVIVSKTTPYITTTLKQPWLTRHWPDTLTTHSDRVFRVSQLLHQHGATLLAVVQLCLQVENVETLALVPIEWSVHRRLIERAASNIQSKVITREYIWWMYLGFWQTR